ncbi:ATP-binding protein [Algoriphagus marinus]|uniref:ATP-binding protein n=1 Tax=Algoriphagus marinus TaxID=1925762 RepID=UPI00094BB27A|nr:ATP-binding protein [Algoriphagus marinus]
MKFYNREQELAELRNIREKSLVNAQMTLMVGRRRIGKTSLLKKDTEENLSIYLFVARKSEILLCEEFVETIKDKLQVSLFGQITKVKDLFAWIMELSESRSFTLIFDEFQEFKTINPSIFSEIQHIWDSKKAKSKINLIFCGSIYSMMNQIFENSKEPLFARATSKINVKPFNVVTLKEILGDNSPTFSSRDLLDFYTFSGGVAKYVESFVQNQAFTFEVVLKSIFSENSFFLEEGKNVLIDEFGKDYATYFSILSLIASSKTSRPEIESILEMGIGGYLDRLENDFSIIKKIKPIFAKIGSRQIKYEITDNFLSFWFRFIYKNRSAIEIGNYHYVEDLVRRDYSTFSGKMLERYFIEKLKLSKQFSEIGTFWDKKNQNEIDIVAINEMEKRVLFAEVKLNKAKINLTELREKSQVLDRYLTGYSKEFLALSLEDM